MYTRGFHSTAEWMKQKNKSVNQKAKQKKTPGRAAKWRRITGREDIKGPHKVDDEDPISSGSTFAL